MHSAINAPNVARSETLPMGIPALPRKNFSSCTSWFGMFEEPLICILDYPDQIRLEHGTSCIVIPKVEK
jgi:hypothetical protein